MPEFYGVNVNLDKLKAYETKDLDYKAQARNLLCNKLGFNPPYQLSVSCELCIRDALKRFHNEKITRKSLDDIVEFHKNVALSVLVECAQAGTA